MIYFIFGLIFLIQLLLVLFTYGKMKEFHSNIDKKFINFLSWLRIEKIKKYSNEIYNFAINSFVSGVVLNLIYLDKYPIACIIILFITLIFYLVSISLIENINIKTLENKYLDEFIIALNVGVFFNFLNEAILTVYDNKSFDIWSIIFLVCFIVLLIFKIKHKKTLKEE